MTFKEIDTLVGKKIREIRYRHNINQMELAKLLKISFQQIQKYEKGLNRIAPSRLYTIAKEYNIPIGWFFEEPDSQAAQTTQEDYNYNYKLSNIKDKEGQNIIKALINKFAGHENE